jgi:hypothetical protein
MSKHCLQCNKAVSGKGKYCSVSCKQAAYRGRTNPVTTQEIDQAIAKDSVNPTDNAPTVTKEPEITPQNEQKPLSGSGNTDDKNLEQPEQTPVINTQWDKAKAKLPGGVMRPTGQPTADTATKTSQELHRAVSTYTGQAWKASSEYAEICYRLITWTCKELTEDGQKIPQWKVQP